MVVVSFDLAHLQTPELFDLHLALASIALARCRPVVGKSTRTLARRTVLPSVPAMHLGLPPVCLRARAMHAMVASTFPTPLLGLWSPLRRKL